MNNQLLKNLLWSVLCILCSWVSNAQTYHPFVEENKIWSVFTISNSSITTTFYKFEGDTLINELPYKYILESYDSSMQIWHKTNKYIREDSQKKVYLLNNSEVILYDFSVQVGDTVFLEDISFQYVVVDAIDSVFIDDCYRKRYVFDDFYQDYWIEGIGSSNSPITPFINFCFNDMRFDMACVHQEERLIYQNPNFDTCYILYIDNVNEYTSDNSSLTFFPQPADEYVSFLIKDTDYIFTDIIVYNFMGQKIKHEKLNLSTLKCNVSDLPSGLYIVSLKGKNKTVSNKLIIRR